MHRIDEIEKDIQVVQRTLNLYDKWKKEEESRLSKLQMELHAARNAALTVAGLGVGHSALFHVGDVCLCTDGRVRIRPDAVRCDCSPNPCYSLLVEITRTYERSYKVTLPTGYKWLPASEIMNADSSIYLVTEIG